MRTSLTRIFLAFLIAWLPASFAYAAAMGYRTAAASEQAGCVEQVQHHAHQHAHPAAAHACKADVQHGHSGCHDCALCYLSMAAAPAIAMPTFHAADVLVVPAPVSFSSFLPELPERPPRV